MKKSNKKSKKTGKKKGEKLTHKQQLFVDYYEGNGTEAARKAGYKGNDNTLCSVGKENLRKPLIIKAIEERKKKEESERNATKKEKLEILTDIMRSQSTYIVKRKDGIEEIIPEIKPTDKIKAIEVHSKISGDLINKHSHTMGKSFKEGLDQVKKHFESHPDKEKLLLKALEEIDEE